MGRPSLGQHYQPTAISLSPTFNVLSLFLTPANLMGEGACDSSHESLLEASWPHAGSVSRFEWPC